MSAGIFIWRVQAVAKLQMVIYRRVCRRVELPEEHGGLAVLRTGCD